MISFSWTLAKYWNLDEFVPMQMLFWLPNLQISKANKPRNHKWHQQIWNKVLLYFIKLYCFFKPPLSVISWNQYLFNSLTSFLHPCNSIDDLIWVVPLQITLGNIERQQIERRNYYRSNADCLFQTLKAADWVNVAKI